MPAVPFNVLGRVFQIRYDGATGTIFTVERGSRQYLVTAQHVVEGFPDAGEVQLFHRDQWKNLDVKLVGHGGEADVTVLAADMILTHPELVAAPTTEGMLLGGEMFFLGFPFGWKGECSDHLNNFPIPFVKSATLSMFGGDRKHIYLDGINNEGFSGGPVGFQVPSKQEWRIVGNVSGYHASHHFIQLKDEDTDFEYYSNSGLIYVVPINFALDLIDANPIGCPIPATDEASQ